MACFVAQVDAQVILPEDSTSVKNNILFYHVRNANPSDLPEKGLGMLDNDERFLFDMLLPSEGALRMEFHPYVGGLKFPSPEYKLIHLHLPQLRVDLNTEFSYSVRMLGFIGDEDYLIAKNDANGKMLYISGNFFKSRIAEFFKLKLDDPASFFNYLKLRYFNMKPKEIHFLQKDEHWIYFKFWSDTINEIVVAKVSIIDFDNYLIVSMGEG